MHFADRGCVCTWRNLYCYATGSPCFCRPILTLVNSACVSVCVKWLLCTVSCRQLGLTSRFFSTDTKSTASQSQQQVRDPTTQQLLPLPPTAQICIQRQSLIGRRKSFLSQGCFNPLKGRAVKCYTLPSRCNLHFYRATACNATHGIAVAILSVCPSVRLSVRLTDACIVTKLNDGLRIFWYHTKQQSLYFDSNICWWAMPPSLSNIHRKWPTPFEIWRLRQISAHNVLTVRDIEKVQYDEYKVDYGLFNEL